MSIATNPLALSIAGIDFPSPLLNASGTFNPTLFNQFYPLNSALGGIVTKTVTPEPTLGNPQPRTAELPGIGMLNSIGLQNPGLAYFLANEAVALKTYGLPVILSISATSSEGFATMAQTVCEHAGAYVDALELNLSCPNVSHGGIHFGASPTLVQEAVAAVVNITCSFNKPVFAKLTPNVGQITPIGEAALAGGATGLTAINTVLGMAINLKTRRPVLPRVSGGYSGPGIKPIALLAVWELRQAFPHVPIMAVGGIATADDVLEFILAGANLVQVGTTCFREPMIFQTLTTQLQAYLQEAGLPSLSALSGLAHERNAS